MREESIDRAGARRRSDERCGLALVVLPFAILGPPLASLSRRSRIAALGVVATTACGWLLFEAHRAGARPRPASPRGSPLAHSSRR